MTNRKAITSVEFLKIMQASGDYGPMITCGEWDRAYIDHCERTQQPTIRMSFFYRMMSLSRRYS